MSKIQELTCLDLSFYAVLFEGGGFMAGKILMTEYQVSFYFYWSIFGHLLNNN